MKRQQRMFRVNLPNDDHQHGGNPTKIDLSYVLIDAHFQFNNARNCITVAKKLEVA